MNAPARFDPAFVTMADTDCDVSHGGETYRAFFTLGPNADAPFLLGVIRYGDECPLDRELTAWLLGLATVLRWEGECPAWGDDDHAAQAGYDAAREMRCE